MTMRKLAASILILAVIVATATAQSNIFIVRHAEKAKGNGNDPDLSEVGRGRAESLAKILRDSGITDIYATEFKRTQQTAAPLAKILSLGVTTIAGKDSAALIAKLRNSHGNILVV